MTLLSLVRRVELPLAAVIALLAVGAMCPLTPSAGLAQTEPSLAIDAGPSGNNATEIDRIEDCVEVSTGDQFQMDIVVRDVQNLLAWAIPIDYQPNIATMVGQDVKLFQQANEGSSVLDLSAKLPDDSGFHSLAAFDSADPQSPDSGSGVLARITLQAVAAGESPIRFGRRDYDSNGILDDGSLLRDVETNIIGDENEDTFFDGEQTDALVVVDGKCPGGSTVAEAVKVNPASDVPDDEGSSVPWAAIAGGIAAAAVLILLGAAFVLTRRGRRTAS